MKRIIIGLAFLAAGIGGFMYFDNELNKVNDKEWLTAKATYAVNKMGNEAIVKINEAKSLEDLQGVTCCKELEHYYNLKKARFLFEKAERYLNKAAEIENAFYIPQEIVNAEDEANGHQQPQQSLHPMTLKLLNISQDYYEQARKLIDNIPDTDDKDFNFSVNFLKGVIYHRFLMLFASQENVFELFSQTVSSYKSALKYKNGDIDTVINIELLIKDNKNLAAASPQGQRNKMLNLRKAGLGNRTGN